VPSFDEANIKLFQSFSNFDHPTYQKPSVAPGIHTGVSDGSIGDDGLSQQAVEEEDEYAAIKNTFDPATVYWRWLHVQVDRWEAISILSNHATIPKTSMDISLLAVRYPDQHPGRCKRTPWESTIKLLIKAKSPVLSNGSLIDPDDVIACLKRKIAPGRERVHGEMNSIVTDFQKLHAGAPRWQATNHCEAIMVSLLTYPDLLCCTEGVRELLKVMFFYHNNHDTYYLI
jgi:hypothetical protein